MTEFMIVAIIVLASLGIMSLLLDTVGQHGDRVINLAGSEYP